MNESIRKFVEKHFDGSRRWIIRDLKSHAEADSLLLGRMASWHVRSMRTIGSLEDVEFKVSSQWGEDGIIDWLIERAEIPRSAHSFVEFGVEDYTEANTRFLLQNRNWRGLVLDGSDNMVGAIERDGLNWRYDLTAKVAFITRENINSLIENAGFIGEVGLLSIDVDGNDYWIWDAIEVIRPILCVCEFNAVFGDLHPISVPYDPAFNRTKKHSSNLYFGASISALRDLSVKKGYQFAGTTLAANDAFFVRNDYADRFLGAAIQNVHALPSRARESRDAAGRSTTLGRLDRLRAIQAMPVVNTRTGETLKIEDLGSVYSDDWLAAMGC